VIEHEAAHAASCLLLGGSIEGIDIGVSGERIEGTCHQRSPDQLSHIISVLVPWVEEPRVPSWLDVLYPESPDERIIGETVRGLGLSAARYAELTQLAYEIAAEPVYDRAREAIAFALESRDHLSGEEVHQIFELATREEATCST
jgi:hypothetical protein